MAGRAQQHEGMPDHVLEAKPVPGMKDNPETIEKAAGNNEPERELRQRRQAGIVGDQPAPAHRQIKPDRYPVEAAREKQFQHDADRGHAPDASQQRHREHAVLHLGKHRRVGCRDQNVDRRMIKPAQQPFAPRHRPEIIGGRKPEHGEQACRVDRRQRNLVGGREYAGQHDQHRGGDQSAEHADPVHDTIGDQFGPIVVPADGAGRRVGGGRGKLLQSEDGHGGPASFKTRQMVPPGGQRTIKPQ